MKGKTRDMAYCVLSVVTRTRWTTREEDVLMDGWMGLAQGNSCRMATVAGPWLRGCLPPLPPKAVTSGHAPVVALDKHG